MQRATSTFGSKDIDYYDDAYTPQQRLFKSTKVWAFYADLEESLGTLESARALYDRIIELRVASPKIIINYATMLEENKYFEDSYNVRVPLRKECAIANGSACVIAQVFEKGVALFKYPHVAPIWKLYLTKFIGRYGNKKLERTRDLFDQALQNCPAKHKKDLFLLYAQTEEQYGPVKRAMGVYNRAVKEVHKSDRLEMYQTYIAKAGEYFGVTKTRSIYMDAIKELPDLEAKKMCLKFAELERALGEVRLVFCTPRRACFSRAPLLSLDRSRASDLRTLLAVLPTRQGTRLLDRLARVREAAR